MATSEDLRELFEQNALFMQQQNQMFEAFTAAALPASHGTRNLDGRRFRELGSFGGNEEEWNSPSSFGPP